MHGAPGQTCALLCFPVPWHTDTLGTGQLYLPEKHEPFLMKFNVLVSGW